MYFKTICCIIKCRLSEGGQEFKRGRNLSAVLRTSLKRKRDQKDDSRGGSLPLLLRQEIRFQKNPLVLCPFLPPSFFHHPSFASDRDIRFYKPPLLCLEEGSLSCCCAAHSLSPTLSLVVISKSFIFFMRFPGSMRCFRPYFVTNQVSGFIKSQISISKVFLESFPKSRLRMCLSSKNSAVQCRKKTRHDEIISPGKNR